MKYKILSLDVWGNADDGYEVNDVRTQGHVELSRDATERDVLDKLIDLELLRPECSPVTVIFDWSDEHFCELKEAATGFPLYHLVAE